MALFVLEQIKFVSAFCPFDAKHPTRHKLESYASLFAMDTG